MHYFEQARKLHQIPVRIFSTIENAPKDWSKTWKKPGYLIEVSNIFEVSQEHENSLKNQSSR